MNRYFLTLTLTCSLLAPSFAEVGHKFPPIKPEELTKIQAALPTAKAVPAKPRKLLVFFLTEGFVHGCIPYANEALKEIGEKTKAYTADFSDDMAVFTPQNLSQYDAVLLNNTTQLKFVDPAARAALLEFVQSGKGFIGIHSATDNFPTWPEGQALIGGRFKSHPWVSKDIEAVKVDDPSHPVTAAFQSKGFWINDEIYQIIEPYNRATLHVLLSLDMSKPENQRPPEKIVRTDNDFPISWVKTTPGNGRVFYSSLGHNPSIYWTPQVLQHYLDGIQFALGDLPAETLPSAKISPAVSPALAPEAAAPLNRPLAPAAPIKTGSIQSGSPSLAFLVMASALGATAETTAPSNDLATGLKTLASYDYGMDRVGIVALDDLIRAQSPTERAKTEDSLLTLLKAPETKNGAKDFILRWLGIIGTEKSIPALKKLVADPTLSHLAVAALFAQNTTGSKSALLESLSSAAAPLKPAILGAIGRAHVAESTSTLVKLASQSDKIVAEAAIHALEADGSLASLKALDSVEVPHNLELTRKWALINAANRLLESDPTKAGELKAFFARLVGAESGKNASPSLRVAAAAGFLKTAPEQAWKTLSPLLKDPQTQVRLDTARLLTGLPKQSVPELIAAFATLDPETQIVMTNSFALAARLSKEETLLQEALNSKIPEVHLAGIMAYGTADLPNSAAILLPLLGGSKEESEAAAAALSKLTSPESTTALEKAVASGSNKAALISIFADRMNRSISETAFASALDANDSIAESSFHAISLLAQGPDFPRVLALLPAAKSGSEKKNLEKALSLSVLNYPDKGKAVSLITAALKSASPESRPSLIVVLATIDSPQATELLHSQLSSPDVEVRKEIIRTLSGVHNAVADNLLFEVANKGTENSEKILALRGYLDSLRGRAMPDTQKLEAYKASWQIALRSEEKEAILSALKNMRGNQAKKLLEELQPLNTPPTPPAPASK